MTSFEDLAQELEPQIKVMSNFKIGKTGQIIGNRFDQEYSKEYHFSMVVGRSSEKEVIDLAKANVIPHFKVAGEFFRFNKEDILKGKSINNFTEIKLST